MAEFEVWVPCNAEVVVSIEAENHEAAKAKVRENLKEWLEGFEDDGVRFVAGYEDCDLENMKVTQ